MATQTQTNRIFQTAAGAAGQPVKQQQPTQPPKPVQQAKPAPARNEQQAQPVYRPARSVHLIDAGIVVKLADDAAPAANAAKTTVKAGTIAVAFQDGVTLLRLPETYGQQLAGDSSYIGPVFVQWL